MTPPDEQDDPSVATDDPSAFVSIKVTREVHGRLLAVRDALVRRGADALSESMRSDVLAASRDAHGRTKGIGHSVVVGASLRAIERELDIGGVGV